MATITFRPGVSWDSIPESTVHQMIDRDQLVYNLGALRAQLAEATGGDMTHVTLDLGLLFDDLVNLCGGYPGIVESPCIKQKITVKKLAE